MKFPSGRIALKLLVCFAMSLAFAFMFSESSMAGGLNKTDQQNLDTMETRFFEHTYPNDDSETRIDRLEKLIFGEAKSGDQDDRVKQLMSSLPPDQPGGTSGSGDGSGSSPSGNSSDSSASAGSGSSGGGAGSSSSDGTASADAQDNSTDYPKVDAIEQTILGQTYKGTPLEQRLDRLEIKAFKQESKDPDLAERVTKLSEYVEKRYHKSVDEIVDPRAAYETPGGEEGGAGSYRAPAYASSAPYGGQSYGGGGAYGMAPSGSYGGGSGSYGMAPSGSYGMAGSSPVNGGSTQLQQVAWLEQNVYGRTFEGNLIERLKRLDATVFPSETPDMNASIDMQIKVLMNAVELMHNSHPTAANGPAYEQQNGYSGGAQPYAGQATTNNFPTWPPQNSSQSQYSNYSANAQQPAIYPYQNGMQGDANNSQYQTTQNTAQSQQPPEEEQQKHGHPLLKSLAKTLMTVGSMAAGSMMMGGMGGMGGYGGYGGYGGMPGYGYGGTPGIRW